MIQVCLRILLNCPSTLLHVRPYFSTARMCKREVRGKQSPGDTLVGRPCHFEWVATAPWLIHQGTYKTPDV